LQEREGADAADADNGDFASDDSEDELNHSDRMEENPVIDSHCCADLDDLPRRVALSTSFATNNISRGVFKTHSKKYVFLACSGV